MSAARKDYPFPAAVADGRVNGGAHGQIECAAALDEVDRLRLSLAWQERISDDRGDENERLRTDVRRLSEQLERCRTELAQATVRLAEWDRMNTVLTAVLPALQEQMQPAPPRKAGP